MSTAVKSIRSLTESTKIFLVKLSRVGWDLFGIIFQYRKILWATTRVELAKRFSGAVFGVLWVVIYPALLLSMYLFIFMVIFKMRFPGYSEMDYVLYVFTGLIPYFGFSEAISMGSQSVRQNMHLVKNVMIPIELIPVRTVFASMVIEVVSLLLLIGLVGAKGILTFHVFWLPIVVFLQILFLIGLVWIFAALAVPLPDLSHVIGLLTLFLFFISPIGFKTEMVPTHLQFMVMFNPISYMAEMFRASILYGQLPSAVTMIVYTVMCVGTFALGGAFFKRFKNFLIDYE